MNHQAPSTAGATDPETRLGYVALTVADLQRSLDFYENAIGLRIIARDGSSATMGAGHRPLLELREQVGATPWPRGGHSYTGLYHFALLLPTRADLGRWLRHWLELGLSAPGQGDHLVSEALYLEDPDGHGIEIYRDRPRDEWRWHDGRVVMATDPVDVRGLLAAAANDAAPWSGLPADTTLGHIHLQVRDINDGSRFYHQLLGFDVMASMPSALFLAAGGYHHHIGMNVWYSKGAGSAPEQSVRLLYFVVDLPSTQALEKTRLRLDGAEVATTSTATGFSVIDPAGNQVRFRARHSTSPDMTEAASSSGAA